MSLPLLLVVVGSNAGLGVADGRGGADAEREAVGTWLGVRAKLG